MPTSSPPSLELLLGPDGAGRHPPVVGPDDAETELSDLYAYPTGHGPWLRANMISSLDGAATGADGLSGSINGAADLRVFTTLRALADVILVGAGTVRAEGYRAPRVRPALVGARRGREQPDHPGLAIVTGRGDVPVEVLTGEDPPIVFTTSRAEGLTHLRRHLPGDRLEVHGHDVDLAEVVRSLATRGRSRVLTEGGPSLLGSLLAAGVVDELCLTTSPVVVGGPAPRVVDLPGWLPQSRHARLGHLLHADGVLLGRWLLAPG